MMKYVVIFLGLILFVQCNKEDGPNTPIDNTDPNYWFFEIKVNDVSHKIEGIHDPCKMYNTQNLAYQDIADRVLTAAVYNTGEPTLVSGNEFFCTLTADSMFTGLNYMKLIETLAFESSGIGVYSYPIFNSTNGLRNGYLLTPKDTTAQSINESRFPVEVDRVATAHTPISNNCYELGKAFTGSGAATIYVLDTIDASLPLDQQYRYRRPYNIELAFRVHANF